MNIKIAILSKHPSTRESLKLLLCNDYELLLTDEVQQIFDFLKNNSSIKLLIAEITPEDSDTIKALNNIKTKRTELPLIICADKEIEKNLIIADSFLSKPFKSDYTLELISKLTFSKQN